MNHELPRCSSWFLDLRGTRDQIVNILWIIGKAREFQKNIYLCFIDYAKVFANKVPSSQSYGFPVVMYRMRVGL